MPTTEQDRAQMEAERNAAIDDFKSYDDWKYAASGTAWKWMFERGWNERNKKVIELQARIDELMLEFCPKEMTQKQRDKWEQNQRPVPLEHVCKSEASLSHRLSEINSLRARNDKLAADADNERILRYAAEAELNAETERCAKIAREYGLSPVVGKAIAALIMEGR